MTNQGTCLKTILSSFSILYCMWNIKFSCILSLSIYLALQLSIPYPSTIAQMEGTAGITPNNDTDAGGSSNHSGIMHNTTGMIDEAFDAIKDSFESLFEK